MHAIPVARTDDAVRNREPWLAASLSWVFPGAGHLYGRLWMAGMALIILQVVLSVGTIALLIDSRVLLVALAPMLLCNFGLHIGAAAAAFRAVRRRNTTEFERMRTQVKDPWLAVFLSVIFPGLGHLYLRKWIAGIAFILASLLLELLVGKKVWGVIPTIGFNVVALICAYYAAPERRESERILILVAATFMGLFWLVSAPIGWATQSYVVEAKIATGTSMAPVVQKGTRLLVNKLVYRWREPAVGDIVLFVPPADGPSVDDRTPMMKRIVAIGGETVQVHNGSVQIDGQYREPEGTPPQLLSSTRPLPHKIPWDTYGVTEPYRVPEGCYFVLGDNRVNSLDSRDFGAVPRKSIIGKAVRIYWPLNAPPLYGEPAR